MQQECNPLEITFIQWSMKLGKIVYLAWFVCTICFSPVRTPSLMMPAKTVCHNVWTHEYYWVSNV